MLVSSAQGCHCSTLLCRTLDPEEADFFYVPAYASCYMHPVWGEASCPLPLSQYADFSMPLQSPQQLSLRYVGWADHPWWHGPDGTSLTSLDAQLTLMSGTWPDVCSNLFLV